MRCVATNKEFINWRPTHIVFQMGDTHPYFYLEGRFHDVFDYHLTNRGDDHKI